MKLRPLLTLGCLALAATGAAQNPDVVIKFDARLNYRSETDGPTTQRLYDSLGRHSLISLAFRLEPGFRAFVSQKLQRIKGRGDPDALDEYYIEDEGIWRIGKQYAPFGSGNLVRESVLGVRGDTTLILEGLPVRLAAFDNGARRQRGFSARVGTWLGVSAFVGEHFGIDATSLTVVREPEDAPGSQGGYREAFGIDVTGRSGIFTLAGEAVVLLNPHRDLEDETTVFDFSATITPSRYRSFTIGYSEDTSSGDDYLRLMGSIYATPNLTVEPMVRTKNGRAYDFNLALRVRF